MSTISAALAAAADLIDGLDDEAVLSVAASAAGLKIQTWGLTRSAAVAATVAAAERLDQVAVSGDLVGSGWHVKAYGLAGGVHVEIVVVLPGAELSAELLAPLHALVPQAVTA